MLFRSVSCQSVMLCSVTFILDNEVSPYQTATTWHLSFSGTLVLYYVPVLPVVCHDTNVFVGMHSTRHYNRSLLSLSVSFLAVQKVMILCIILWCISYHITTIIIPIHNFKLLIFWCWLHFYPVGSTVHNKSKNSKSYKENNKSSNPHNQSSQGAFR